jgi:putative oxidoreductase
MLFFENRYPTRNLGLLLLRVGIGIMFTIHGYPKLIGGSEKWAEIGGVMQSFGIGSSPVMWGFLAAVGEAIGGQLLAFGLFFRTACLLLLSTMLVATAMHLMKGDDFNTYSHAMESAFLFLGLLFVGPGKYSVDQMLFPKEQPFY